MIFKRRFFVHFRSLYRSGGLDDNGLPGPSSSHGAYYRDRFRTNFQTNREGVRMSDEDEDPEPSCFEDPEFFYDSDARYEDQ